MGKLVRRREFITGLGGTLVLPITGRAQGLPVVAIQMGTSSTDTEQASLVRNFVEELARLGWSDRSNIQVTYRWADGDPERLKQHAAEIVKLSPKAIFAQGTPVTLALAQATSTIPIVFVNVSDPTDTNIVDSFARPGRNVTGFTNYEPSMGGKWLDVLHEIAPRLSRVLIVFNAANPAGARQARSIADEATSAGITGTEAPARNRADLEKHIDTFRPAADSGLLVMPDFLTTSHRDLIVERAAHYKCPAIFPFRHFVTNGGLAAYSVDQSHTFRQAADYVNRILRGADPAGLPVQAPTKFELSINLKTAKQIGFPISPALLTRADEVIE
jgi:putative ABC transport system substrate-binding protein